MKTEPLSENCNFLPGQPFRYPTEVENGFLGYSWIDPQCRVENSVKKVEAQPTRSFFWRAVGVLFCFRERFSTDIG